MNRNNSRIIPGLSLWFILVISAMTTQAAGDSADILCDQMGREIALRAAEQLGAGINAANRSTLADIARQACLEYQAMPQAVVDPARVAEDPVDESDEAGLFDVEIIYPQDRVKRPGLKRR